MFVEMSVYQVMVKEFGDFIFYDFFLVFYDDFFLVVYDFFLIIVDNFFFMLESENYINLEMYVEEDVGFDIWIDEILSGLFFVEFRDSLGLKIEFGYGYKYE